MIIENPHSADIDKITGLTGTDCISGLTTAEAQNRQKLFGLNTIRSEKQEGLWKIFFVQFKSPMVLLLLAAAALSVYFSDYLDAVAILVVIAINALLGFYMEFQAVRSMNALKKLVSLPARVFRDQKLKEIPAELIVPGDILFLEAGDMVAGDARIFHSMQLEVDESALTGESLPVAKSDTVLPAGTALAERTNMIFKGTYVTKGNARAIVTGTGMNTELGKIAGLVEGAEQSATPLEKKLEKFSKRLIWITLALVVLIFIAGLFHEADLVKVLETSIALAVAAIPEGLPIVATLALAKGMLRMAEHNVIVKKLAAVETLGGTNIICTDKTGTLTENRIEVNTVLIPGGKAEIKYGPGGEMAIPAAISSDENFQLIARVSVLCNTAVIDVADGQVREIGDPLETGLLKFAVRAGVRIESVRKEAPEIRSEAFTSETKVMGTVNKVGSEYRISAKGAVEELIARCSFILVDGSVIPLDEKDKQDWIKKAEGMAAEGLRLLGFAYKEKNSDDKDFMNDLTFLGVLGMLDPARKEVPAAIQECREAGIKVIMITGDHPATALNIGLKLGLVKEDEKTVIHGCEMKDYNDLSLEDKIRWRNTHIFARVTPKQKLDLVTVLQEDKSITGMTGDGVNDAPAIKKADIGIAMGLKGTQVAQEVSDMILKDDSFTSIVVAIRQGRIIFENIKKFVTYLLSCNMSELIVVAIVSLLNLHFALLPLQILFINLITDVLPALALGVSEGNPLVMKRCPRNPQSEIISSRRWLSIVVYAVTISFCVLGAVLFSHYIIDGSGQWDLKTCNSILFYTLILTQLVHVFNMASSKMSFFVNEITTNRYIWIALALSVAVIFFSYKISVVRTVLGVSELAATDWLICVAFSIVSLLFIQIFKRLRLIH